MVVGMDMVVMAQLLVMVAVVMGVMEVGKLFGLHSAK